MGTNTLLKKYVLNAGLKLLLFSGLVFCGSDVMANPQASFTADQTTGCSPLTVQFTSTSTGATSYYWDLGNGNSSTLANPSNLYSAAGTYTITLIAYDGAGNSDTARYTNYITVVAKPVASFSADHFASCLDGNSYSFTNTSTGAATYLWDFGDGNTSTQANPVHTYALSGVFSVTLMAVSAYGCQDVKTISQYITIYPKPDPTIIAATTASCDPATVFHFDNTAVNGVSWLWNFGDGLTSTSHNPAHVYNGPGVYDVSLIVTNNLGCSDTSDVPTEITVGLNHWGNFTSDVDSGCASLTVQFSNNNANCATAFWTFGDGQTSTDINPQHIYTAAGTYSVTLIVTTTTGCADTIVKPNYIFVGPRPTVSFTYANTTGCSPLAVQFTNTSTNFTSCLWTFGDGTTSTATSPTHVYTNNGIFTVVLKCWGPTGCTRSAVYHDIIHVTSTEAIFNANPRVGCPPLTVNFAALSPVTGLQCFWDFGDGSTSTQQNPVHTYNTAGVFDVTLVVRDSLGCTDTLRKAGYIQTVNPAANYVPPPTTVGCAPLTTQFTDNTAGSTGWLWDFGDGTTSTLQNPVHTYNTPGNYTVALTTTSAAGGCAQTISNFSTFQVQGGYAGFTHTVSPCPPYVATFQDTSMNAVSWFWDFGDGTTSTQQNPAHTYNSPGYHSVSLTITTADGCSYTTMQSNSVYFTPFGANFYGLPLDTVFPNPVQFYANSLGATSWLWDFGDGGTSTQQNPLHVYQNPGNYNVTLTISNGVCTLFYDPPPFDFGSPDTTPIDPGNPGIPEIQQGCAPLNVQFTNHISGTVIWNWDFGDGDSSNVEFPSHVYTTPGIYNVVLTATDTLGITQVWQMDSIVRVSGPQAGFGVVQNATCTSTQITLVDSSVNAVSWSYNFGDGYTSTAVSPTHTYSTANPNYVLTQTVTDTMGCSASISTSLYSSFISPLLASENEVCGRDTVHFYTSLQNFSSYHWDFGDGTSSNLVNPSHVFTTEGTFNVSLTITDNNGCSQTYNVNPAITVNLPVADFTTTTGRQSCNQINIQFVNNSQNATMYQWDFGDGTTSSLQNPFHTWTEAGIYDVTLTVYSGSCVSTQYMPQYIEVDTAHAEFSFVRDQSCLPFNATFTDLSVNPVSWSWHFGDGDTSNVQNPTHLYLAPTTAHPYLAIVDIHGCKDTVESGSFPLLVSDFEAVSDSGCFPFTVQFNSNVPMITTEYFWDFGDGTTSTDPNPSHTYASPGQYDVSLVIGSIYVGCHDTLVRPAYINVLQPHAGFFSTDLQACAPSIVNFTDQSNDADQYLWDFGDGTTSSNANPTHIYNVPGTYTVSLIATSSAGCSDTITRPDYIQVLGPITHFTSSATEGCSPFAVNFTDQSQNAVSWSWNFGDGYNASSTDAYHVFADSGSFTVSLVTQDTSGCTSYYELPQKVVIHPSPVADFTTTGVSGCQPVYATFTNLSTGQISNSWNFGDNHFSTDQDPVHEFTVAGNYQVQLVVENSFGCTDTAILSQPINVMATPQPAFSASDVTGCSPFHVTFINYTANTDSAASYFWDFGNGQTSTAQNPTLDFTSPGFYDITLTVTNLNGCSDVITYPAMIHVLDSLPPNETNILSVSVVNDTQVKIIWENNPAIDLAAYVVYRKADYSNTYSAVYTDVNPQNSNFSLTSDFTDTGLNTLLKTYTYKVQAIDICGNTIPLDSCKAHTTVNISSQRAGKNIAVNWTPYGGATVDTYELYRSEQDGAFYYIATVPGNSLDYVDSTFICPYPYRYKVMATNLNGTTYTSYSDTSQTIPLNTLENQIVDVVRSTVVDNQTVLTEWRQPIVHPEMVAQFDVYRSTDNVNFRYLTTVPSLQTDYMDYNVDVQNTNYYYKILVINTCNINEDPSMNTSTIVLKGNMDESRMVHLEWTPYKGWDHGVEYYILEKKDENGHWQFLKQVDGETRSYDYQE